MRAKRVCIMMLAAVMALSMAACVPREAPPEEAPEPPLEISEPEGAVDTVENGSGADQEQGGVGLAVGGVGEIVTFGEWRGESIAWRVLAVEDGRALLISENILTERAYHENDVGITWADSEIRAWLNSDFLDEAFSAGERREILLSQIPNPDNPYGTPGGRDTEDRVFLLSIDEAERYFRDDNDRIAEYEGEAWWWWLRSPGSTYSNFAANVLGSGGIDGSSIFDGAHSATNLYVGGVRPALYINL